MARQIIDLPLIDKANISDDDFLLIRDVSERRDKRVRVGDVSSYLANLIDFAHPIGSILRLTNDFNPSALGGSWRSLGSTYERQLINSYVFDYTNDALNPSTQTVYLLGSYNYTLLEDMLNTKTQNSFSVPDGWHVEYKLSGQVSSSDRGRITLCLNNIETNKGYTWSGDTYRQTISTDFFTKDQIELEKVINYNRRLGINFGYKTEPNSSGIFRIYHATLLAFLTSDKKINIWERVA